jgi:metallo-beta-lactamase family protein
VNFSLIKTLFGSCLNRRLIASGLCLLMTIQSADAYANAAKPEPQAVYEINLPNELGVIESFHQGTNGKTIIFIQDAHDSLEAQENIAKIVEDLVQNQNVKTVFEEGYEGELPTKEYFGDIQDSMIKEKLSYFLMDKLRLGGAEYAHINRQQDFKLMGVDDRILNDQNIKAYQEAFKLKDETHQDLKTLRTQLQKVAYAVFPNKIKNWIKLKERFDLGQIELIDYLKRTHQLLDESYRGQYYPWIHALLKADRFHDAESLEKVKGMDHRALFSEINRMEKDVTERLIKNEKEQRFFDYLQDLQLLERLNEIEISADEYAAMSVRLAAIKTQQMVQFIAVETQKPIAVSKQWEGNIKRAILFYELAHQRDRRVGELIKKYSEEENEDTFALVFGGFHKNKISSILKTQGFSLYTVSPKISSMSMKHQNYYKEVMGVGHYDFETPLFVARAAKPFDVMDLKGQYSPRVLLSVATNPSIDWTLERDLLNRQLEKMNVWSESRAELRARKDEPQKLSVYQLIYEAIKAVRDAGIADRPVRLQEGDVTKEYRLLEVLENFQRAIRLGSRGEKTAMFDYMTLIPALDVIFEQVFNQGKDLSGKSLEVYSLLKQIPNAVPRSELRHTLDNKFNSVSAEARSLPNSTAVYYGAGMDGGRLADMLTLYPQLEKVIFVDENYVGENYDDYRKGFVKNLRESGIPVPSDFEKGLLTKRSDEHGRFSISLQIPHLDKKVELVFYARDYQKIVEQIRREDAPSGFGLSWIQKPASGGLNIFADEREKFYHMAVDNAATQGILLMTDVKLGSRKVLNAEQVKMIDASANLSDNLNEWYLEQTLPYLLKNQYVVFRKSTPRSELRAGINVETLADHPVLAEPLKKLYQMGLYTYESHFGGENHSFSRPADQTDIQVGRLTSSQIKILNDHGFILPEPEYQGKKLQSWDPERHWNIGFKRDPIDSTEETHRIASKWQEIIELLASAGGESSSSSNHETKKPSPLRFYLIGLSWPALGALGTVGMRYLMGEREDVNLTKYVMMVFTFASIWLTIFSVVINRGSIVKWLMRDADAPAYSLKQGSLSKEHWDAYHELDDQRKKYVFWTPLIGQFGPNLFFAPALATALTAPMHAMNTTIGTVFGFILSILWFRERPKPVATLGFAVVITAVLAALSTQEIGQSFMWGIIGSLVGVILMNIRSVIQADILKSKEGNEHWNERKRAKLRTFLLYNGYGVSFIASLGLFGAGLLIHSLGIKEWFPVFLQFFIKGSADIYQGGFYGFFLDDPVLTMGVALLNLVFISMWMANYWISDYADKKWKAMLFPALTPLMTLVANLTIDPSVASAITLLPFVSIMIMGVLIVALGSNGEDKKNQSNSKKDLLAVADETSETDRSELREGSNADVVGLVFGKFVPFHNGHELLLRKALSESDKVILLLYDHPDLSDITTDEMARLIAQIIDDKKLEIRIAYNPPAPGRTSDLIAAHNHFISRQIGSDIKVSKVFHNGSQGDQISQFYGAELIRVDEAEKDYAFSTTSIRENPEQFKDFLHPLIYDRVLQAKEWSTPERKALFYEQIDTKDLGEKLPDAELASLRKRIKENNPNADQEKLLKTPLWEPKRFDQENLPSVVGELKNKKSFSQQRGLRLLDMAFLLAGQGVQVPKVLEPYLEAIEMAIKHEQAINPDFNLEDYNGYITIDQKLIEPSKTQRRYGPHGDAYVTEENTAEESNILTNNTYVAYDVQPTDYYAGPFPLGDIDSQDDERVLKHFAELALTQTPIQYPGYTLLRMTPYDIHTPSVNTHAETIERTFIKITFSKERFNLLGNRINPLFSYAGWAWVSRDVNKRNHRNHILNWDRPDKDTFTFVDPTTIRVVDGVVDSDWTESKTFWGKKVEAVKAEKAMAGERLETMSSDGFITTFNIAQQGDWKITTSQGDSYFVPDGKFKQRYKSEPNFEGLYEPLGTPSLMVKITKPVRFRSPWGSMQYAPAGSVLTFVGKKNSHAIMQNNFEASYVITNEYGDGIAEERSELRGETFQFVRREKANWNKADFWSELGGKVWNDLTNAGQVMLYSDNHQYEWEDGKTFKSWIPSEQTAVLHGLALYLLERLELGETIDAELDILRELSGLNDEDLAILFFATRSGFFPLSKGAEKQSLTPEELSETEFTIDKFVSISRTLDKVPGELGLMLLILHIMHMGNHHVTATFYEDVDVQSILPHLMKATNHLQNDFKDFSFLNEVQKEKYRGMLQRSLARFAVTVFSKQNIQQILDEYPTDEVKSISEWLQHNISDLIEWTEDMQRIDAENGVSHIQLATEFFVNLQKKWEEFNQGKNLQDTLYAVMTSPDAFQRQREFLWGLPKFQGSRDQWEIQSSISTSMYGLPPDALHVYIQPHFEKLFDSALKRMHALKSGKGLSYDPKEIRSPRDFNKDLAALQEENWVVFFNFGELDGYQNIDSFGRRLPQEFRVKVEKDLLNLIEDTEIEVYDSGENTGRTNGLSEGYLLIPRRLFPADQEVSRYLESLRQKLLSPEEESIDVDIAAIRFEPESDQEDTFDLKSDFNSILTSLIHRNTLSRIRKKKAPRVIIYDQPWSEGLADELEDDFDRSELRTEWKIEVNQEGVPLLHSGIHAELLLMSAPALTHKEEGQFQVSNYKNDATYRGIREPKAIEDLLQERAVVPKGMKELHWGTISQAFQFAFDDGDYWDGVSIILEYVVDRKHGYGLNSSGIKNIGSNWTKKSVKIEHIHRAWLVQRTSGGVKIVEIVLPGMATAPERTEASSQNGEYYYSTPNQFEWKINFSLLGGKWWPYKRAFKEDLYRYLDSKGNANPMRLQEVIAMEKGDEFVASLNGKISTDDYRIYFSKMDNGDLMFEIRRAANNEIEARGIMQERSELRSSDDLLQVPPVLREAINVFLEDEEIQKMNPQLRFGSVQQIVKNLKNENLWESEKMVREHSDWTEYADGEIESWVTRVDILLSPAVLKKNEQMIVSVYWVGGEDAEVQSEDGRFRYRVIARHGDLSKSSLAKKRFSWRGVDDTELDQLSTLTEMVLAKVKNKVLDLQKAKDERLIKLQGLGLRNLSFRQIDRLLEKPGASEELIRITLERVRSGVIPATELEYVKYLRFLIGQQGEQLPSIETLVEAVDILYSADPEIKWLSKQFPDSEVAILLDLQKLESFFERATADDSEVRTDALKELISEAKAINGAEVGDEIWTKMEYVLLQQEKYHRAISFSPSSANRWSRDEQPGRVTVNDPIVIPILFLIWLIFEKPDADILRRYVTEELIEYKVQNKDIEEPEALGRSGSDYSKSPLNDALRKFPDFDYLKMQSRKRLPSVLSNEAPMINQQYIREAEGRGIHFGRLNSNAMNNSMDEGGRLEYLSGMQTTDLDLYNQFDSLPIYREQSIRLKVKISWLWRKSFEQEFRDFMLTETGGDASLPEDVETYITDAAAYLYPLTEWPEPTEEEMIRGALLIQRPDEKVGDERNQLIANLFEISKWLRRADPVDAFPSKVEPMDLDEVAELFEKLAFKLTEDLTIKAVFQDPAFGILYTHVLEQMKKEERSELRNLVASYIPVDESVLDVAKDSARSHSENLKRSELRSVYDLILGKRSMPLANRSDGLLSFQAVNSVPEQFIFTREQWRRILSDASVLAGEIALKIRKNELVDNDLPFPAEAHDWLASFFNGSIRQLDSLYFPVNAASIKTFISSIPDESLREKAEQMLKLAVDQENERRSELRIFVNDAVRWDFSRAGIRFLDEHIETDRGVFRPTLSGMMEPITKLANTMYPKKIIDMGSGQGAMVFAFAYENESAEVLGIEYDPALFKDSLKVREIVFEPRRSRIRFEQGDFNDPKFAEEIQSADVINYWETGSSAETVLLETVAQNLRQGAYFLVTKNHGFILKRIVEGGYFDLVKSERNGIYLYVRNEKKYVQDRAELRNIVDQKESERLIHREGDFEFYVVGGMELAYEDSKLRDELFDLRMTDKRFMENPDMFIEWETISTEVIYVRYLGEIVAAQAFEMSEGEKKEAKANSVDLLVAPSVRRFQAKHLGEKLRIGSRLADVLINYLTREGYQYLHLKMTVSDTKNMKIQNFYRKLSQTLKDRGYKVSQVQGQWYEPAIERKPLLQMMIELKKRSELRAGNSEEISKEEYLKLNFGFNDEDVEQYANSLSLPFLESFKDNALERQGSYLKSVLIHVAILIREGLIHKDTDLLTVFDAMNFHMGYFYDRNKILRLLILKPLIEKGYFSYEEFLEDAKENMDELLQLSRLSRNGADDRNEDQTLEDLQTFSDYAERFFDFFGGADNFRMHWKREKILFPDAVEGGSESAARFVMPRLDAQEGDIFMRALGLRQKLIDFFGEEYVRYLWDTDAAKFMNVLAFVEKNLNENSFGDSLNQVFSTIGSFQFEEKMGQTPAEFLSSQAKLFSRAFAPLNQRPVGTELEPDQGVVFHHYGLRPNLDVDSIEDNDEMQKLIIFLGLSGNVVQSEEAGNLPPHDPRIKVMEILTPLLITESELTQYYDNLRKQGLLGHSSIHFNIVLKRAILEKMDRLKQVVFLNNLLFTSEKKIATYGANMSSEYFGAEDYGLVRIHDDFHVFNGRSPEAGYVRVEGRGYTALKDAKTYAYDKVFRSNRLLWLALEREDDNAEIAQILRTFWKKVEYWFQESLLEVSIPAESRKDAATWARDWAKRQNKIILNLEDDADMGEVGLALAAHTPIMALEHRNDFLILRQGMPKARLRELERILAQTLNELKPLIDSEQEDVTSDASRGELRSDALRDGDIRLHMMSGETPGSGNLFDLRFGQTRLLLDAGKFPESNFDIETGVDAVLVSHGHRDHIEALPELVNVFPETPLLMSSPTALYGTSHWREAKHTKKDVERAISNTSIIREGVWYQLNHETKVLFSPASHILGADLIYISTPKGNFLYTGDYSDENLRSVPNLQLLDDFEVDYLISESVYGDRPDVRDRDSSEKRLVEFTQETFSRGGNILIPGFTIGRIPEIVTILRHYQNKGEIDPEARLYIDGQAAMVMENYENYLSNSEAEEDKKLLELLFGKSSTIVYVKPWHRSRILNRSMPNDPRYIYLAGHGMLGGGRSVQALSTFANPKDSVIQVGYQGAGTLGRRILDKHLSGQSPIEISYSIDDSRRSVTIHNYEFIGFSAHASQKGLLKLIGDVNPRITVLIHGDDRAKAELKRFLKESVLLEKGHKRVLTPNEGDELSFMLPKRLSEKRKKDFSRINAVSLLLGPDLIYELPELGSPNYDESRREFTTYFLQILGQTHDSFNQRIMSRWIDAVHSGDLNKVIAVLRKNWKSVSDGEGSKREKEEKLSRDWDQIVNANGDLEDQYAYWRQRILKELKRPMDVHHKTAVRLYLDKEGPVAGSYLFMRELSKLRQEHDNLGVSNQRMWEEILKSVGMEAPVAKAPNAPKNQKTPEQRLKEHVDDFSQKIHQALVAQRDNSDRLLPSLEEISYTVQAWLTKTALFWNGERLSTAKVASWLTLNHKAKEGSGIDWISMWNDISVRFDAMDSRSELRTFGQSQHINEGALRKTIFETGSFKSELEKYGYDPEDVLQSFLTQGSVALVRPYGFEQNYEDVVQLRLLKEDFKKLIRKRSKEQKVTFTSFGLGGAPNEVAQVIKAFYETLTSEGEDLEAWEVNYFGFDFFDLNIEAANQLVDQIEKRDPETLEKLTGTLNPNLHFRVAAANIYDFYSVQNAVSKLSNKQGIEADYIFERNVTYANEMSVNGMFRTPLEIDQERREWKRAGRQSTLFRVYLAQRNIILNVGRLAIDEIFETRYIVEPYSANLQEGENFYQPPGLEIQAASSLKSSEEISEYGTGILILKNKESVENSTLTEFYDANRVVLRSELRLERALDVSAMLDQPKSKGTLAMSVDALGKITSEMRDELLSAIFEHKEVKLVLYGDALDVDEESAKWRNQLARLSNVVVVAAARNEAIEKWGIQGSVAVDLTPSDEGVDLNFFPGKRIQKLEHVRLKNLGDVLMAKLVSTLNEDQLWWTHKVDGVIETLPGFQSELQSFFASQAIAWSA